MEGEGKKGVPPPDTDLETTVEKKLSKEEIKDRLFRFLLYYAELMSKSTKHVGQELTNVRRYLPEKPQARESDPTLWDAHESLELVRQFCDQLNALPPHFRNILKRAIEDPRSLDVLFNDFDQEAQKSKERRTGVRNESYGVNMPWWKVVTDDAK